MATPDDRRRAAGVFFLVLGIYLITYVGAFKSNDERAYFSGMDSFVKRGQFTANQIYWDYTAVGVLTTGGDMVPNYEPGQMVAPIPLYLWGRALGAAAQGVLFFNALVLAGAAALLYLCFVELAYRRVAALLGALVFAFATLAWPYSRTFFREPLTTFAYLLAFYALLRYRPPAARRWIWPALAGFGLGLAIVTKLIGVGVIPGLAVLAWSTEWRREPEPGRSLWRTRAKMAAAAFVPLAALLVLYQLYTWLTLSGVETFSRNIVEYTTNPQLSQTVPMRMLRALAGITVSPYKGLFWYSPVLLLGFVAAWPFIRKHRWEGWAALLIVLAHVLGYSRYNYWSGGVAWGMRYLLPITPFLVLLAAPVWDFLTRRETPSSAWNLAGKAAVWVLIVLSAMIAVLGVSIDVNTWEVKWLLDNIPVYGGLGQAIEALMLRPEHSPVLGHLRLLLAGQPLDFAWVQLKPEGATAVVWPALVVAFALAAVGTGAFFAIWRRPQRARSVALLASLVFLAGATGLVLLYRSGDARYDKFNVNNFLEPMIADLDGARCTRVGLTRECPDVFLVPDPALTDYFLNYLDAPLPWYALESAPVDEALGERLVARYDRVLLGRDRSGETDDQEGRRGWERWLTDHAYKLNETRYEDWARLLRFSAAGAPAEISRPAQSLGEFTLDQSALSVEGAGRDPQPLADGEVVAQPAGTLQVALTWRADRKPEANYTAFLQVLDEASQVGRAVGPVAGRRPAPDGCTGPRRNADGPGRAHVARRAGSLPADCRDVSRRRRRARRVSPDPAATTSSWPILSCGRRTAPLAGGSAQVSIARRHSADHVDDRPAYLETAEALVRRLWRSGWWLPLLLTLPALAPLLQPGFYVSDDGLFHVYRIAALADAWQHGVLYPRLFPQFGFGYGQAVFNFYAPLSYAPGALLAVLGVSPEVSAEWTVALGFVLAVVVGVWHGQVRLGARRAGCWPAVIYTYFPYHLADAYLRGALPEHMAFVFLAAHRLDDRRCLPGGAPRARLPLVRRSHGAALAYTHNLTLLLMAPAWAALALALALRTGRWNRFWGSAGGALLGGGPKRRALAAIPG